MDDLAGLEQRLGHRFANQDLLRRALVHRSYVGESGLEESNERLEFLGDAVLDLVVASALYARFSLSEGEMAKVRARVVSEPVLAEIALEWGLDEAVMLGRGEETSGGRQKDSILSDTVEAVIGAVYLDGGFQASAPFVLGHWQSRLESVAVEPGGRDFKTRLQEVLAQEGKRPDYDVVGSGPDHERVFEAVVTADGVELGRGAGSSKKRAQQAAAERALAEFDA